MSFLRGRRVTTTVSSHGVRERKMVQWVTCALTQSDSGGQNPNGDGMRRARVSGQVSMSSVFFLRSASSTRSRAPTRAPAQGSGHALEGRVSLRARGSLRVARQLRPRTCTENSSPAQVWQPIFKWRSTKTTTLCTSGSQPPSATSPTPAPTFCESTQLAKGCARRRTKWRPSPTSNKSAR